MNGQHGLSRAVIIPVSIMIVIAYFALAPFFVAGNIRRGLAGKSKIQVVRAVTAPARWTGRHFRPYYEYLASVVRANIGIHVATWEEKEAIEELRRDQAN